MRELREYLNWADSITEAAGIVSELKGSERDYRDRESLKGNSRLSLAKKDNPGVSDAEAMMRYNEKQDNEQNRVINQLLQDIQQNSRSVNGLKNLLQRLSKSNTDMRQELDTLEKEYSDLISQTDAIRVSADQVTALKNQLDQISREKNVDPKLLEPLQQQIEILKNKQVDTSGFEEIKKDIQKLSKFKNLTPDDIDKVTKDFERNRSAMLKSRDATISRVKKIERLSADLEKKSKDLDNKLKASQEFDKQFSKYREVFKDIKDDTSLINKLNDILKKEAEHDQEIDRQQEINDKQSEILDKHSALLIGQEASAWDPTTHYDLSNNQMNKRDGVFRYNKETSSSSYNDVIDKSLDPLAFRQAVDVGGGHLTDPRTKDDRYDSRSKFSDSSGKQQPQFILNTYMGKVEQRLANILAAKDFKKQIKHPKQRLNDIEKANQYLRVVGNQLDNYIKTEYRNVQDDYKHGRIDDKNFKQAQSAVRNYSAAVQTELKTIIDKIAEKAGVSGAINTNPMPDYDESIRSINRHLPEHLNNQLESLAENILGPELSKYIK